MPEGYRHLTRDERCRIGALKESGLSDGAIAARLGRKPRLPAIPYARATPPLREWPVLHFGVEVGGQNGAHEQYHAEVICRETKQIRNRLPHGRGVSNHMTLTTYSANGGKAIGCGNRSARGDSDPDIGMIELSRI